jgi:hypothetical protein
MPPDLYPPPRPQSIGEVLDAAFRIYKATLLRCLPYGALAMVAGQIPNIFDLATGRPLRQFGGGEPVWWVLFGLGTVLTLLLWNAMLLRQMRLLQKQAVSFGADLREGVRYLPALVLALLLSALALAAGFALLLVPGLYLLVALSFVWPAVLLARQRPAQALAYSVRLVRGQWWRTLLIYTVGFVIAPVFALLALVLAALVLPFAGAGAGDVAVVTAFWRVIAAGVGAVAAPFYSALMLALFADLQARRPELDPRPAAANGAMRP